LLFMIFLFQGLKPESIESTYGTRKRVP